MDNKIKKAVGELLDVPEDDIELAVVVAKVERLDGAGVAYVTERKDDRVLEVIGMLTALTSHLSSVVSEVK